MLDKIKAQVSLTKEVAHKLANIPTAIKNKILLDMANALEDNANYILEENQKDVSAAIDKGISPTMIDRLKLTPERIMGMAIGVRQVAKLDDPIGEVLTGRTLPNGLAIKKIRVPLGVVGIIYESRPNVTVDAAALCIKSGNAVVLKGGSEAILSNSALVNILTTCLEKNELPRSLINFIDTTDRSAVSALIKLNEHIDVIIPRGGAGLIQTVIQNSTIPVIETGVGICHIFIDESADIKMARKIIINAKTSRPAVCNAMECMLVHKNIAEEFLPKVFHDLQNLGVRIQACPQSIKYGENLFPVTEENFATENLDLIVSVKIVDDLSQAVQHIDKFGTKHSEAIITQNYKVAKDFQSMVDAAVVFVNASTRFTDGFEFGLGAEIGISTQKLHARGPMGLTELTSIKYLVDGNGQVR